MGIKVTTLPNVNTAPTSTNLLGTMRISGIEKAVLIKGINLNTINSVAGINSKITSINGQITNINLAITSLGNNTGVPSSIVSRLSTASVANTAQNNRLTLVSAKVVSVNTRLVSLSATLENRLSAVSALAGGSGYNDALISARITSVNENVTSALTKIATVSGRITSVNENTTSALTKIAVVSSKLTSVNNRFKTSCYFLSGASINITNTYENQTVRLNHNTGLRARIIPTNFNRGSFVNIIQHTSGAKVSIGSTATLRSRGGVFRSNGQYAVVGILCVSANEFVITGDVSA